MAARRSTTPLNMLRSNCCGEEAFDGIEPGCRGWCDVEMDARMSFERGADLGMLVRGVVVNDEMQVPVGRGFAMDLVEKADELLMPMAVHALADDLETRTISHRRTLLSLL